MILQISRSLFHSLSTPFYPSFSIGGIFEASWSTKKGDPQWA